MPITRVMDEQLKTLLEGINSLKNSQEETRQEMQKDQVEMQKGLEETRQEMQKGVEETRQKMQKDQQEMQKDLENVQKFQELNYSLEEKINSVKDRIARKMKEEIVVVEEKMEKKVEEKIEMIREVAGNFSLMSQRVEDLGKEASVFRKCDERKQICPCCSSTCAFFCSASDFLTSAKACQLAESLRRETSEVLQTLPDTERLNLNSLYNVLDLRFGQKYSKDYARLQIKTRLQKTRESLQEYASEVERLANLAFSDHPATVREVISLQYFVEGVEDGEIQKAVRMADVQDLKSALKLQAANEASCRDRHSIRGARGTADAPCESSWTKG
ncbi:UNVERIFIED_CONTAM: hypothetical protein NCL1_14558 [Trichonephila clavipes]